jgi:hypothetical protein
LSDGKAAFVLDLQSICNQRQNARAELSAEELVLDQVLTLLFRSSYVHIVGFGVSQDLGRAAASYPHMRCFTEYRQVVDMSSIFRPHFPKGRPPSLSALCELALGLPLDKSQQSSQWHIRPLSTDQVKLMDSLFNTYFVTICSSTMRH